MVEILKKIISLLLAVVIAVGISSTAFAADEQTAELYTIYADSMLFQHSKEAILAGTAKPGNEIKAELYLGKKLIASGESTTGADGKFTVSFMAPKGSYTEYIIILYENGKDIKVLKNIVFGELWLASGQSNMMYPLAQSLKGVQMWENKVKLSKNLRVLMVPGYPEYKDQDALTLLPRDPQDDITDAVWVTGEDEYVYNMSAVAYFFAEQLMKKLDMPVGILNSSLGGSSIASWLSRETCESDKVLTSYLAEKGQYVTADKWKEDKQDVYTSVTGNYNQKIHPLKNFRPTGMIWYQGETDIGWEAEMYGRAFDLMQSSYSKLFGFENNEQLPIIYTQLAPYYYGTHTILPERNLYYTDMQQKNADSRAVISIHDLPLTYFPEVGVIHPASKESVGHRMFFAAEGLVYGDRDTYTVSTIKNTEIKDGAVYVTFDNIGDGLKANGEKIRGFAICGESGVYVEAKAEIISADTVKIWSEDIKEPKSASYAYCTSNMRANLYATEKGFFALPIGPFVTDKNYMTKTWLDIPWTDCETEKTWFNLRDPFSGFYDSWTSQNATLSFTDEYMNITSEGDFTIKPTVSYYDGEETSTCTDSLRDWSSYGKLTFSVRNNGKEDVIFDSLRLYRETFMWYSPKADQSHESSVIIPADGQWHEITLDLNSLYLYSNECGIISPNNMLKYLLNIELVFISDGAADVDIDNFRFTPEEKDSSFYFETTFSQADNVWEFLSAIFSVVLGIFFRA
ncbi:MAG: sialate O-acetylesterase [Ruminococcaceae bacterium]|nr:sialate O-acetylesterase [Oscillospiraceae bacterium]